jgi:DNA-directed RNA polymerase specialized sigma24 family protein
MTAPAGAARASREPLPTFRGEDDEAFISWNGIAFPFCFANAAAHSFAIRWRPFYNGRHSLKIQVPSRGELRMASEGSVSRWIGPLKAGDPRAAQQLWERYFQRLVGVARKRLQVRRPRSADEEDVALSAFDNLCRGARQGRFPQLEDRDDLWRLLVLLTVRKASHVIRDEGRQKRGARPVALPDTPTSDADETDWQQLLSREPTPEFAAQVAEQCQRLLDLLEARDLRSVALLKMEGYTTEEIAQKLDCTPRTIFRKLGIIRGLWEKENGP